MKLVIFDLDQTLVDFIFVHDEVTRDLFQRFFGVDARLTEIDFAGRSLNDNFRELAKLKNVSEATFNKTSGDLLHNYEEVFAEKIPENGLRYILPGVRELLDELSKMDYFIVLYTGGSPKIVASVFRATGLGRYFRFCFYGTEVATRADMVRLAIAKAEETTHRKLKNRDIVILGDSIKDIECGKLFNALTIAVATGFHSVEKLSKFGPDYLFKSLKDYRKVLQSIG